MDSWSSQTIVQGIDLFAIIQLLISCTRQSFREYLMPLIAVGML